MYVFTHIMFKNDFWGFFIFVFYIEAKFSNLVHVFLHFTKLCLNDTVSASGNRNASAWPVLSSMFHQRIPRGGRAALRRCGYTWQLWTDLVSCPCHPSVLPLSDCGVSLSGVQKWTSLQGSCPLMGGLITGTFLSARSMGTLLCPPWWPSHEGHLHPQTLAASSPTLHVLADLMSTWHKLEPYERKETTEEMSP